MRTYPDILHTQQQQRSKFEKFPTLVAKSERTMLIDKRIQRAASWTARQPQHHWIVCHTALRVDNPIEEIPVADSIHINIAERDRI